VVGEGDGQGGGARPGADHPRGQAAAGPLVDQGGGEGGLEGTIPGPRRPARYAHSVAPSVMTPIPGHMEPARPAGPSRRCTPRWSAAAPGSSSPTASPRPAALELDGGAPGHRPPGVLVDMPGHAGSSHIARRPDRGRPPAGAAGGRAPTWATPWAPASASTWPWPGRTWSPRWSSSPAPPAWSARATARHAGPVTRCSPSSSTRPPTWTTRPASGRFARPARRLPPRWLDNPSSPASPRGPTVRRAAAQHRTGPGSSLRLAGTGTQLPLWDRLDWLRMPVLLLTRRVRDRFTETGRPWPPPSG